MAKIQGLDSLLRKLDKLGGSSHDALKKGITRATGLVRGDAKELCPVNEGRLRNSIGASIQEKDGAIVGKVSTNIEYAPYVEFGTGPVGRASPKDLPPELAGKIQYKADGWWIHSSQIDAEIAEKYHFFRWESPDGEVFYRTEGQPAHPFLYPALKQNTRRIKQIIKEEVEKEIERLGG